MMGRSTSFGQSRPSVIDRFFASRRFAHVRPWVPGGAILVDLGCGYRGEFLRRLADHIRQGIGLDLSVDDTADIRGITLRRARIDAALPVEDGRVDVVCAMAVIEHLDDPEMCLRECHRILRPGGALLLTTPSAAAKLPLELLAFRLRIISRSEIEDHKRYYTRRELLAQLKMAGFEADRVAIRTFEFGLNFFVRAVK